jgi:hypothetical protein
MWSIPSSATCRLRFLTLCPPAPAPPLCCCSRQLAPGGHLGRFIIFTKSAFDKLDSVFGEWGGRWCVCGGGVAVERGVQEGSNGGATRQRRELPSLGAAGDKICRDVRGTVQ